MATTVSGSRVERERLAWLRALERKVLWLSSWMIHHANHLRPNRDELKIGGRQASSACVATQMTARRAAAQSGIAPA